MFQVSLLVWEASAWEPVVREIVPGGQTEPGAQSAALVGEQRKHDLSQRSVPIFMLRYLVAVDSHGEEQASRHSSQDSPG